MSSSTWIDELLKQKNNNLIIYHHNKQSLEQITIENNDVLKSLQLKQIELDAYMTKLYGYFFVDEIYKFNFGKFYRWIKKNADKLYTGGILVDMRFLDKGVHLLFKTNGFRFHQIPLDSAFFFQKMTIEDQIQLLV
jgi:hypothetical protein